MPTTQTSRKSRARIRTIVRRATLAALLCTGCTSAYQAPADRAELIPPPAPAQNTTAARGVADKVEQHSHRTEKAEGKQDLVKDAVTVTTDAQGQPVVEQKGEASYYGQFHQGRKTADGSRFDAEGRTAAHPTLPLGTKATVTNLDNGKKVDVTITDRGPYARGRDIDLSKGAANQIGISKKSGVAPVQIDAAVTPTPAPQP